MWPSWISNQCSSSYKLNSIHRRKYHLKLIKILHMLKIKSSKPIISKTIIILINLTNKHFNNQINIQIKCKTCKIYKPGKIRSFNKWTSKHQQQDISIMQMVVIIITVEEAWADICRSRFKFSHYHNRIAQLEIKFNL